MVTKSRVDREIWKEIPDGVSHVPDDLYDQVCGELVHRNMGWAVAGEQKGSQSHCTQKLKTELTKIPSDIICPQSLPAVT